MKCAPKNLFRREKKRTHFDISGNEGKQQFLQRTRATETEKKNEKIGKIQPKRKIEVDVKPRVSYKLLSELKFSSERFLFSTLLFLYLSTNGFSRSFFLLAIELVVCVYVFAAQNELCVWKILHSFYTKAYFITANDV